MASCLLHICCLVLFSFACVFFSYLTFASYYDSRISTVFRLAFSYRSSTFNLTIASVSHPSILCSLDRNSIISTRPPDLGGPRNHFSEADPGFT